MSHLKVADGDDVRAAEGAMALAHLLACLRTAVQMLDECGFDIDARVVEAHAAQLQAGREWPGMPVAPWVGPDEEVSRP